jgi:vitamin B12/bleomycin/antimicrobial peptide transport system ATP-binding/permease protein
MNLISRLCNAVSVVQAGFAFSQISDGLSLIVSSLTSLSALAAQTERLYALCKALDLLHAGKPGSVCGAGTSETGTLPDAGSGEGKLQLTGIIQRTLVPTSSRTVLFLDHVSVSTPYVIADELSLEVSTGQSLLIMGPSGCGKSSLLRVIAGLWTHGEGSIATVPKKVCCFTEFPA